MKQIVIHASQIVGIRAEQVVTCDDIVRSKMSENADETSKNADKAF